MEVEGKHTRLARGRGIACGFPLHRVPDGIVTAGLADQMARHVGRDWYAAVMFADGRGVAAGQAASTPAPPESLVEWMAKAATALNKDLHQDGHWVVAWAKAVGIVLLWRDGDGDIHLACEVAPGRGERIEDYDKARLLDIASDALAGAVAQIAKLALGRHQMVRPVLERHRHH